jgi:hypothetical protein
MSELDKETAALYKAVEDYVEAKGGKLVVIGGVQVQKFPGDLEYNFRLAVRCTGRMPEYAEEELINE